MHIFNLCVKKPERKQKSKHHIIVETLWRNADVLDFTLHSDGNLVIVDISLISTCFEDLEKSILPVWRWTLWRPLQDPELLLWRVSPERYLGARCSRWRWFLSASWRARGWRARYTVCCCSRPGRTASWTCRCPGLCSPPEPEHNKTIITDDRWRENVMTSPVQVLTDRNVACRETYGGFPSCDRVMMK